jgi:hypothetical protein
LGIGRGFFGGAKFAGSQGYQGSGNYCLQWRRFGYFDKINTLKSMDYEFSRRQIGLGTVVA